MQRRGFLVSVGSAVALAGCLGSAESDDEFDVGMSVDSFRPAEFAVAPGTTVVWKNTSKSTHTVTAVDDGIPDDAEYFASGGYDSLERADDAWYQERGGAIESGETYEHTFAVPGTYSYLCIPHRKYMVGTIEVTEDATRTPSGADGANATNGTAPADATSTTVDATSATDATGN